MSAEQPIRLPVMILVVLTLLGCGNSSRSCVGNDKQKNEASDVNTEVKINPDAQRRVNLKTTTVVLRSVPEYLTAAGQIVMDEEKTVHIGVYASGRITDLRANVGDSADRGEILARMHSHDVHETRAAYESAQQEVQRQRELVDYQRRMRDRMQRLLELKSASPKN